MWYIFISLNFRLYSMCLVLQIAICNDVYFKLTLKKWFMLFWKTSAIYSNIWRKAFGTKSKVDIRNAARSLSCRFVWWIPRRCRYYDRHWFGFYQKCSQTVALLINNIVKYIVLAVSAKNYKFIKYSKAIYG